jgi:hypothetical protein
VSRLRYNRRYAAAARIQQSARRMVARKRYVRLVASVRRLQPVIRGHLARSRVRALRRKKVCLLLSCPPPWLIHSLSLYVSLSLSLSLCLSLSLSQAAIVILMFYRRGRFRLRVARRVQAILDAKARSDLTVSLCMLSLPLLISLCLSMPRVSSTSSMLNSKSCKNPMLRSPLSQQRQGQQGLWLHRSLTHLSTPLSSPRQSLRRRQRQWQLMSSESNN